LEDKLLFFSVLMAYSQRNDHFCGCKGTHYYLNYEQPETAKIKYLRLFNIQV